MKKSHIKLTAAMREEITQRALKGEKQGLLAIEFGVSRAYVSLLKQQALIPAKRAIAANWKLKLSVEEEEQLRDLFATSSPAKQKLDPPSDNWSLDLGKQLAIRLFGKPASLRVITNLISPFLPKPKPYEFKRPEPPKPHHISQLSPELARDPEFVAYYLSPQSAKLAQREYELAVADYDARFATPEELAEIASRAQKQ